MNKNIKDLIDRAGKKDKSAMHKLAISYLKGKNGLSVDVNKAYSILKESADLGNYDSVYAIAKMHLVDKYGVLDVNKSLNLLKKSTKVKHVDSLFELGSLYYYGKVVEKDYELAQSYFREAANAENPKVEAQYLLAYILENGLISEFVRVEEAFRYYKKAAENNHSESLFKCGVFYLTGKDGIVDIDVQKSIEYFKKASNLNHFESKNFLAKLYIEESKKLLSETSLYDEDARFIKEKLDNVNTDII